MRRRDFIIGIAGSAAAWPFVARAQEASRVYRLGVLHQLPRTAPQFAHLVDGLRRQGFIEGRNLAVDPRGFDSRSQRLSAGSPCSFDTTTPAASCVIAPVALA